MISKKYLSISIFCFLGLFQSCQEDELSEPEVTNNTVNGWIYNKMKSNYLWLEEIPEYKYLKGDDTAENFFQSLISDKEKKVRNGNTYWYSYMEKKHGATKVSEYPEDTYGIEYVLYQVNKPGQYFARVIYVTPNTPAQIAGVKRGMWIKKINGQSLNSSNYKLLDNGSGIKLSVYEGVYNEDDQITAELKVGAQVSIYSHPILHRSIVTGANGKKIGYLVYNHFSPGPTGYTDKAYNDSLNKVFQYFKAEAVTEFILDLRYNPGGYIDCAVNLASYLVKQENLNRIFCRVDYNSTTNLKSNIYNFNKKLSDLNLNLDRVYILTGQWTASASEAVINGLKPMMDVIQIGAVTEGKNLGSLSYSDDRYDWILHPIVAKIANEEGKGDYWTGILPNIEFDEFRSRAVLGELGTLNDSLIYKSLKDMELLPARSIQTKASTQPAGFPNLEPGYSSLSRKSLPAVRIN